MDESQLEELSQWGRLPYDLYIVEKWNTSSTEDEEEQRIRLANEYVHMGAEKRTVYHDAIRNKQYPSLTQSQIDTILRPLQTSQERRLYLETTQKHIWLRTCYKAGTDALHQQLISSLEHPVDEITNGRRNETLFNDRSLYDYGKDWTRIFRRIPELADGQHGDFEGYREAILEYQLEAVREFQEDEIEDLDEPDYSEAQHLAATTFLFVEDEDTFQTGLLLVIWLDDCGRVVRQARTRPDRADEILGLTAAGAVCDACEAWLIGEIGEAYREGGICGPPYGGHE